RGTLRRRLKSGTQKQQRDPECCGTHGNLLGEVSRDCKPVRIPAPFRACARLPLTQTSTGAQNFRFCKNPSFYLRLPIVGACREQATCVRPVSKEECDE